ncbi:glycosyltransferase, partial [Micrococcus luteus]
ALLSTEHGIAPDDGLYNRAAAARVKNAAHRARLRGTDLVIAVAQSTADVLRRKWGTGAPLTVVRNGVDVPAVRAAAAGQRRTPGEGLRILSLSRLAPEKGLDRLIAALPVLLEQDPGTRLTLAGVGPLEGQLRAQAEALGVADAVDLPGFVEPWETMAEHDVLVQLSAWENLSYTLLDAAAAGLPAVATDVGGNGEILPPERLVHETTPAAIADAVVRAAAEGPGEVRVADVETMARATAEATLEVLGRRVGKTLG